MLKGVVTSTGTVAAMILAVLVAALIGGAYLTLRNDAINPKLDEISDKISQLQRPTVTIGDNGVTRATARREFRGLVVYNMLTAANCNLVPLTRAGLNYKGDGKTQKGEKTDIKYFEGFRPAINGLDMKFENKCAKEVVQLPSKEDYLPFVEDQAQSSDLEGRQGWVQFNVSQNFVISDEKLMKANFRGGFIKNGFLTGDGPPFWNNEEIAFFVPAGIEDAEKGWTEQHYTLNGTEFTGTADLNWITKPGGPESRATLYSYRIRMKNVPKILETGKFRSLKFDNEDAPIEDSTDKDSFERFVRDAKYVFCSGVSGTLQTNAYRMNFGGEAQADKSKKENSVYPEVSLGDGGSMSCLKDNVYSGNPAEFVDYQISGNRCTYGKLGREITISRTGVHYTCRLMSDSFDFPGYRGKVDYLKTGWKADQSTCSSQKTVLLDDGKQVVSQNGRSSGRNFDLTGFRPPKNFHTTFTLSHPQANTYPGTLYLDIPGSKVDKVLAKINIEKPFAANKKAVMKVYDPQGTVAVRYSETTTRNNVGKSEKFSLSLKRGVLKIEHLGTGFSVSEDLRSENVNVLPESVKEVDVWVNDEGTDFDSSRKMKTVFQKAYVTSYPKGCVVN